MQNDKKNCFFFFCRQKRGNSPFTEFSFSGTLLLMRSFFYGTAEAGEISGSIDYYKAVSQGVLDIYLGYPWGGGVPDISLDQEVRPGSQTLT